MNNESWKIFEQSGNIFDYLNYACTNEKSQLDGREGVNGNESGSSAGDGIIGYANRRI